MSHPFFVKILRTRCLGLKILKATSEEFQAPTKRKSYLFKFYFIRLVSTDINDPYLRAAFAGDASQLK